MAEIMELDAAADIVDIDQGNDIVENAIKVSSLTKYQKQILREEVHDFITESSRGVPEIAEKVGCHVTTIYNAHRDQRYMSTFDQVIDKLFANMGYIGYQSIVKSAREGKVSAAKLILQITGKHTDKIQTENVNVNVDIMTDNNWTPRLAVEHFLTMLGTRGWSLDQIIEIWQELKESQAF